MSATKSVSESRDVYQIVTDKIVAMLEEGTVPWHKPWRGARNLVSNKEYRGINAMLLGCQQYTSPYWLTFKEALDHGGHVKKGEKSTLIVFWKWINKTEDADGEETTKRFPILRYYLVFNLDQCEGVKIPKRQELQATHKDGIESAQAILNAMPNRPTIQHIAAGAYYSPSLDLVNVPDLQAFESAEHFYSTFFHELTHSTGHSSRCARGIESNSGFGSETYAKEELVAEMGAAFLTAKAGIENYTVENSASYIQSWLRALKNDKRLVVMAAAAAQKAADYILGTAAEELPRAA